LRQKVEGDEGIAVEEILFFFLDFPATVRKSYVPILDVFFESGDSVLPPL